MSSAPQMRRQDHLMPAEAALALLAAGFSGRLATMGKDGFPYVTPLLYVIDEDRIVVHQSSATGHLRSNIDFCDQVCFEVEQSGSVYAYGRFECDSGLDYASVVAFGRIEVTEGLQEKQRFCSALMAKYGGGIEGRPKDFFPRINSIAVYTITIERMTGKLSALPPASEQWPAMDRTKTPGAVAPRSDPG